MRTTTKVLFVVGFIVGSQAVVALDLAGSDGAHVSDGVPIGSPTGPQIVVQGSTNLSLENPADANQINLVTEEGNITLTSLDRTEGVIETRDITGKWTNLSNLNV